MTELFLSRHGETIWHAENRYTGSSDIALTPAGYEQANRLAKWASTADLDAIVSSTLTRSIDTAAPSVTATGLELVKDERLVEVDFGRGEGLTRTEMRGWFPEALDSFLANPGTVPLPGGERGSDAIARSMVALDELCERYRDGRVLVVMHSTLMRLLLCHFLGIDIDGYRRVFPQVRNAALTIINYAPPAPAQLLGFNIEPNQSN